MKIPALRRCLGLGVAVACAAALAGCGANQDLRSLFNPTASARATTTAPAKPAAAQTATVPPSRALARLHDMNAPQVEALVGSPDFRRVEPPAELWQYRSADCVVDLFFYGADENRRVVHEDARPRDAAGADMRRCGDGSDVLKDRPRG